ncbi:ATP-binding protein [Microbulbifer sp.]|uniref:sensor histidine kinase n=1 Tax=Microbulbifer sp. TaxID=1908541 RepID=UPI00258CE19C|nr:ATP-binding protein [Microbulbifer sp.]
MTTHAVPDRAPGTISDTTAAKANDDNTAGHTHEFQTSLRFRQRDLLRIYAWYRVVIGLVLLGLFASGISRGTVGTLFPTLYLNTAITYAVLNVAWLGYLFVRGFHTTPLRIVCIFSCDILTFLLLIQASGGLDSGVGYLLLTTCAVGSLLLDRRMGAFLAAITSIAVISQQLIGLVTGFAETQDIVSAGSLGILLFTCVSALQYLSTHIRLANRKAEAQSRQAAHLQRLTQQIVAQMRTGVLVLNDSGNAELANRAAQQMLGSHRSASGELSPVLRRDLAGLLAQQDRHTGTIHGAGHSKLRASYTTLPRGRGSDSTLIFLEDSRKLAQEAQQLKLASLGRLTGSIAHEIRNPLGAISHAAQLLAESDAIAEEDRQLTDIIGRHSQRVNQIIENVMLLSRRQAAVTERQDLCQWLPLFVEDFCVGIPETARVSLSLPDSPVFARFDPNQFGQVLTNLCQNALRHSFNATGIHEVEICASYIAERQCARLDVLDRGPGVPAEHQDKIFEPFFTTDSSGAGLGLYIARELCEATRANLYFCRNQDKRSCFRVEFANAEQVF